MSKDLFLINLVKEHKALFKLDKTDENEIEIDLMAAKIRGYIFEYKDDLAFEIIVESLTNLGEAPSIIYDDNGHFAVVMDGTQNVLTDENIQQDSVFSGDWFLKYGAWKKTLREALYFYLDNSHE